MKVPTNLLKDAVNHYLKELIPLYGDNESRHMIYLLTTHFFEMDRLAHTLNPDFRLSESELLKLHFAVKDLIKFKPIQYIIGKAWFCGKQFQVSPAVLIPRPETEELTEIAARALKLLTGEPQVLDIGTGSGCIAITLKLAVPQAQIHAIDIDEDAIALAKENAIILNADVHFKILDLRQCTSFFKKNSFDLIVSNPPYVTDSDKSRMKRNVLDWEPAQALFVPDSNPLVFYRYIADLAVMIMRKNGLLLLEINENYGPHIVTLLKNKGFKSIELLHDIHGRVRFVKAVSTN